MIIYWLLLNPLITITLAASYPQHVAFHYELSFTDTYLIFAIHPFPCCVRCGKTAVLVREAVTVVLNLQSALFPFCQSCADLDTERRWALVKIRHC